MLEKVVLFYSENENVKISMKIYFNEQNQLIFDGYDIGKTVNDVFGDSDYEYDYLIEPNEAEKLYEIFGLESRDKSALLQLIKDRFGGNKAYTLFGNFLDEHLIEYISNTWT